MKKTVIITLVLIGAIEYFSSYFLNNSRYNEIYSVLRSDSSLLWRVRKNLNKVFFGVPLVTNDKGLRLSKLKEVCQRKIGIFGASPSFGWGVSEESIYTSQLNDLFKSRGVCFINYSVIGFSSTQGIILLREKIIRDKLDALIVSYLVNDVEFNRFYFSGALTDAQELQNLSKFSLRVFIQKLRDSNSYKLLRQVLIDEKNESIKNKSILSTISHKRVSEEEFLMNIQSMLELAKSMGVDFYYLEMPVGLQVMANYLRQQCNISFGIENKLEIVKKKIFHCHLSEYKEFFRKNRFSVLNQARSLVAMKRFNHYRESLRGKIGNGKIIKVREVGLKDLGKFFLSEQSDFVHPSARGHQQIADDIFNFLTQTKSRL